jgi:tRNA nucleotidyltransferase/poly(A) polymerase
MDSDSLLANALQVVGLIRAHGYRAVVAGGAVRDRVLGRPLTDVDIATDIPLDELAPLIPTHDVGRSRRFETVVVTRGGHAFEVTRFRGDREAADPLQADTAHRDFTVNALVLGDDGGVIDLQGGLDDLRARLVRAVGSPDERFAEDPLRVLRAVRFAASLGFTIEAATAEAMRRGAAALAGVAGERVGAEVLKMASQPGPALAAGVVLLDRFGLLETVLPEVGALQGLEQPAEWHPEGDAWEHTLAALRASATDDPAVNLAVLLHDVGKRPAHFVENGRHRYHGHEKAGIGLVEEVARRLFLPQRLRAALLFAVENHGRCGRMVEMRRSKRLALVAAEHWAVLRALVLCDIAARGVPAVVARAEEVFREAERDAADLAGRPAGSAVITGKRIMALTGLAPGPRVGEIQRRVREWALDNRVEERESIEAEAVRVAAEDRDEDRQAAGRG